jgi:anti-sigma regulatory factor (Ser/Thr protein kinase)
VVPEPRSRGLRHAALFYEEDESFQDAAIAFVREGVECGELALVHAARHPGELLRREFAGETAVRFEDSTEYVSPVGVIDRLRRTMDKGLATGVPAFRAIRGAVLDAGPVNWLEWLRFEAAVNRALASYPLTFLCSYDNRVVDPEQAVAMGRAHPFVCGSRSWERNEGYVEPLDLLALPEYSPSIDRLQLTPPTLVLNDVGSLRDLRNDIYPAMLSSALSRKQTDDFVKAVGEVVVNAHEHGAGRVALTLWSDVERMVCTVVDQGDGIDDPFMGYSRATASPDVGSAGHGMGLWAARQLCDTLDYVRTDEGFTVRLSVGS